MLAILYWFKCILKNKSLTFSTYYCTHISELHILFFSHVLIFNKTSNEKYTFEVFYNNKHEIIENML